jgi:1,5-anhydro-D-fructose reductase (1,5-anhydro-D-mannitol-forming)
MSELGWGFIGASNWARTRLVPAVQATDGVRAIAVFSTSAERGHQFAHDTGLPRSYDTLEALLDDPEVDVVYVSTTNDLHASQTIAAAAAGKHVLCEKPLSTTLADARRMQSACDRAGVLLATNHHQRGAATVTKMRQLIEDGAIGDVVAARISFTSSLPVEMRTWRLDRPDAGGGVAFDLTVHDADTLRYLLDDEIVEVSAMSSSGELGQGIVEDSVMGVMRTGRGLLVCFHDSFVVPHAGNSVEIHGTTGSLIGQGILSADPVGDVWLRRLDELTPIAVEERWPLYENVVARITGAIRGDGQVLTSGEDGIASLAIAIAALESVELGRSVTPSEPVTPTA